MASLTSARSRKSNPTTSPVSTSIISSPGSVSGASACVVPDGQMTDLFGQALAPAAPSRKPGSASDLTTRATYGRNGFGSSASAGLSASLVSNLRTRSSGSILFQVTWRASVTPSGRLIYRLRASEARTDASALASWPTPTTPSGGQTVPHGTTVTGRKPDGSKAQVTLDMAARASGWATPAVTDRPRSDETMAKCADFRKRNANQSTVPLYLGDQALLSVWPTPTVTDGHRGQGGDPFGPNQTLNMAAALTGSSAVMDSGARLNPDLARSLMRIPKIWASCQGSVTRSTSRRSRT